MYVYIYRCIYMFMYIICKLAFCFSKKGFKVRSYGSGTHVKLPGPSPQQPNIYDFNTTYDEMHQDLSNKDNSLYPLIRLKTFY